MAELYRVPLRLRPVAYCGPVALAALTGAAVEDVEAAINAGRGARAYARVRSVFLHELAPAARRFGFQLARVELGEGWGERAPLPGPGATAGEWSAHRAAARRAPTLGAFLRARGPELYAAPLLVFVTRHFVAVCGARFADSNRPGGCSIAEAPGRKARVKAVFVAAPLAGR
jgi:hypothetical protein